MSEKKKELQKVWNKPEKSAFIKNFDNIAALQFTGDLYIGPAKVSDTALEELRTLVKTVIEIYGEDWDIHLVKLSDGNIAIQGIDILYPEVQINNSDGRTHDIKDLYIRLVLGMNRESIYLSHFSGARGKVSLKEYSCGYQHSHLHQTTFGSAPDGPMFDSFCTGSGEINRYREAYNDSRTAANASKVLLQLYTLASWESIEGVPYFHISAIEYRSGNGRSAELIPVSTTEASAISFANKIARYTQEGKIPVKGINVDVTPDNKISVAFDEEYIVTLMSVPEVSDHVGVTFQNGIYKESSVKDYLANAGNSTNPHNVRVADIVKETGYIYNGKEIALEIYDFDPTATIEKETVVELIKTIPDAQISRLKKQFEKDIYEQQVTRIISERYA